MEGAAIPIRAMIRKRREEFVQQITMRRVQFQHVEAGRPRPLRGRNEILLDLRDSRGIQFIGLGILGAESIRAGGHRAMRPATLGVCRDMLFHPRPGHARLSARMRQLHARQRFLTMNKVNNLAQLDHVFVAVDAQILRCDAPFRRDGGRFENHQRSPADSPRTQVDQMPLIREAVHA